MTQPDAGATTRHETSIEIDERVPAIHITRDFDATPAQVFRAHSDPELLVRWLGPRGLEMTVHHLECRTGGSYRYTHSRGEEHYGFSGSFHEVRPGELIVQTFAWDGMPDDVALERMTFTDLGDGRTRLRSTSLGQSFEARDQHIANGMETGVVEGYERLDEVLAG
jgi:uncharacterized protein YndB with AHSA1/START domain